MRKDMGKVLTECVKFGGYDDGKKAYNRRMKPRERRVWKNTEVDLRPKQESMRKPHKVHYGGKQSNDNLAPLKRFLHSRCGKPWNSVWSEICSVLKGNSLQAKHVKDHVKDFVDIPHSNHFHSNRPRSEYSEYFFVDKAEILRHHRRKAFKMPKEKK